MALLAGAVGGLLLAVPSVASAASGTQAGLFGHLHLTGGGTTPHAASGSHALPASVQVVATGLNQPRKIAVGPDGNLLVTEAGTNDVPAGCTTGAEPACANPSGAIARVTPSGQVTTLVPNLPSVNNGPTGGPGAAGPSGISVLNGQIQFLTQNVTSTRRPVPRPTGRGVPFSAACSRLP
jgi:glucose/arabinose dehydrogenase